MQINETEDGRLVFGLYTDIGAACARNRAAYVPLTPVLGLDFGLWPLFATDRGDLRGRSFLDRLRRYDHRITRLAAYRQAHGMRVRSPRHDREVERLRGFLRETIGRVLNRLVKTTAPGTIVVERLDFRSPHLSKRLNRLVSTCGRKLIREKLRDLEERFGIEIVEVNPAYSSQTCSGCDYVDRENRQGGGLRVCGGGRCSMRTSMRRGT